MNELSHQTGLCVDRRRTESTSDCFSENTLDTSADILSLCTALYSGTNYTSTLFCQDVTGNLNVLNVQLVLPSDTVVLFTLHVWRHGVVDGGLRVKQLSVACYLFSVK